MLRRLSNSQLVLCAVLFLLIAMVIAAYPTYTFVRGFVVGALYPLEQFDANTTVNFKDDDPYARYVLALDVDHPDEPLPAIHVNLDSPDGEVITEETNQWARLFGREYRRFLIITAPPSGRFNVTVESDSNADFLIYRKIDDVYERELGRSMILWITACVPVIPMLTCISIVLWRIIHASDKLTLDLDSSR